MRAKCFSRMPITKAIVNPLNPEGLGLLPSIYYSCSASLVAEYQSVCHFQTEMLTNSIVGPKGLHSVSDKSNLSP